jgi:DNA-binding CsgD family transcriptional regulator
MTPHNSDLNFPPSPPANCSPDLLNQLQSDLVFLTRMSAVDEASAAMAHQLNDPLTALSLYLQEIKEKGSHLTGSEAERICVQDMVDMALRETERVCDIVQRAGQTAGKPHDAEAIAARASGAVESWPPGPSFRKEYAASPALHYSAQSRLTPREREVLALITSGESNKQGGYRLGISTRTFEVHRAHIMAKFGAKNTADLVRMVLTESH